MKFPWPARRERDEAGRHGRMGRGPLPSLGSTDEGVATPDLPKVLDLATFAFLFCPADSQDPFTLLRL